MVCRVKAGQTPMDAIVSATSRGAEALRLGKEVGSILPGYAADLVAVKGNPLNDISAMKEVQFVMRGGRVYRNDKP
jgi:imidazolonepropionase-like amidohydrolase